MTPTDERELLRRVERSEAHVIKLLYVCAQLAVALYHHTQDRHDVDMRRDNAPDVRAVANARRSLNDDAAKHARQVAQAAKEDMARGKRVGHTEGAVR